MVLVVVLGAGTTVLSTTGPHQAAVRAGTVPPVVTSGEGGARERLVEAAFALFDERGFDATTVDDVAERAGVGRTTFFRSFRSKEDVIFPHHEALAESVHARLAEGSAATAESTVVEAARLVLHHYLGEGERARTRYRLTRSVPALRAREVAGQQQYLRLYREALHGWFGRDDASALRAELIAGAVVTAHNHVLRRWLRGLTDDPEPEFDAAMGEVQRMVAAGAPGAPGPAVAPRAATQVVVLRTDRDVEDLLPDLRRLLD